MVKASILAVRVHKKLKSLSVVETRRLGLRCMGDFISLVLGDYFGEEDLKKVPRGKAGRPRKSQEPAVARP